MNIHYVEILYNFLGENLKKYLNMIDEKKFELLLNRIFYIKLLGISYCNVIL